MASSTRARLEDLAELSSADGTSLLTSLIESFILRAGSRVEVLERAVTDGRPRGGDRVAHELKGASGTIGAPRVMTLRRGDRAPVPRRPRSQLRVTSAAADRAGAATGALEGDYAVLRTVRTDAGVPVSRIRHAIDSGTDPHVRLDVASEVGATVDVQAARGRDR